MKIQDVDFSLYVITDPYISGGRMHVEVVRLALEGGATVIEFRDKHATLRRQLEVGQQLRELTRQHGATLIVNDRPDLAMAVEADGVHVGPDDLPPDVVRKIVGPDMLIAASAYDAWEAKDAADAGADFIVARPVFRTGWSGEGAPRMGIEGLKRIVDAVQVPVVAVGGIRMSNIPEIFAAGAVGPGITTAVVGAEDPRQAAEDLRRVMDQYRKQASAGTSDIYSGEQKH